MKTSPVQLLSMDSEIAALKALARSTHATLKRQSAKDTFASLMSTHRRKLIDLAIELKVQPIDALLFQRALPRPAWVPLMSWEVDREYDLAAWIELEDDNLVRAMFADSKVQNWRELVQKAEDR